tara:strand:+ start:31751 stop:32854 length:1104 start_codon:yes stop_codon:yes gene_type:complete
MVYNVSMKLTWFPTIFSMLFSSLAFASERFEFYNGIRPLGMGNASVASVNDETALIVNPAGLGKLRNFFGTILDPELDMGSSALNTYRAKSFSNPTSVSQVLPAVAATPGDYFYARTQLFPSFVARNFGIGLLVKNELGTLASSATSASVFYRDDMALLLGYNFRFWDGRIKLGFTGKIISRTEVNETAIDPSGAVDLTSLAAANQAKHGLGIGSDVGLILTAPWDNLPTLAIVARDIGNTTFDKTYFTRMTTNERPNSVAQDIDAGLSFQIIHRPNIRSLWAVDYHGILTAKDEEDKNKLYHLGVEVNFGDVFFFRAGYNQRYVTAGFELASERFQFQIATYGEEVGTAAEPKEDRRNVAKITFRF